MERCRMFARGDLRPLLSVGLSALLALTAILTDDCALGAAEPATVEQAERVLDLRALPMIEGGKVAGRKSLGILMYEAPGDAATAFDFLRKQLTTRGWKELPDGYKDANNASGAFQKEGYNVAVSTSSADGAEKSGRVNVTLVNHGNIDLAKLPTPPGVKPFLSTPGQKSYLTESKIPETAEACRKLLIDAGWEPYGTASADPQSPMLYFKRNAIRLMAWVSSAPAQGNKTVIHYSTDLLSADLPMPPDAPDPRYDESQKTVRFDWPGEDGSKVIKFYQARLADKNWKATTDHPITDDSQGTQFLIFRNPQGDLISLDLRKFTDIVRVTVRHQSAAEVAESDRLAKEEIARRKLEKERRQITVNVPLPATAGNLKQPQPDSFEFTLGKGQGPDAFQTLREHFASSGWSETEGTKTDATVGRMEFKKGEAQIRFRYFDIGIGDAELSVNGSEGMTLAPKVSKDKQPPVAGKPVGGKRPTIADIPGIGELPAGVELPEMPAEVGDLLKGLNDSKNGPSGGKNGKPQQAPAGNAPPAAGKPVKVAEISIPPFATSVEYSKTTKMIKLKSSSDVATLAQFFLKELGAKGWDESGKPLINEGTAILKLSRGDALLTIFVHQQDDGSDATIVCKGVAWDVTPASRVAAKQPGKPRTERPAGSAPATGTPAGPAAAPRVVAVRITPEEQKQTGATLWAGGKVYKLGYGVAYSAKQADDDITMVLLSVKPIAVEKLVELLKHGKDGSDAVGFDPHLKLRFDADGKLSYLFLYAEGLSVNQSYSQDNPVKAELTIEAGRARGKAVMEKPGKLFDNEYRFDATFDAKLAVAGAKPGAADAPATAAVPLVAEEQDGLPIPMIASSRSSVGSRYRKSVTVSVPTPLATLVDFYRRELPARGWRENAQAANIEADKAQLAFTGAAGSVSVRLTKQEAESTAELTVRFAEKAKAAGLTPQPNKGRVILGNASGGEATLTINGQAYKVPAGAGAKDPKNGVSLNVAPGKYTFRLKIAGKPDQTEEIKVAADETWGAVILPTGGYLLDQLY